MDSLKPTIPLRRKLKRYEVPGHLRYLTFSCYRRIPLFHNDRIKDAFVEHLKLTRERLGFDLFSWVIMPEHIHLLLRPDPPRLTVTHISSALKRPFSNQVLNRWRSLEAAILGKLRDARGNEHFWQRGGGYDRNIVSRDEFVEKIRYIHNNPVRRGLVETPAEWRWSSARWYLDRDESVLGCDALA